MENSIKTKPPCPVCGKPSKTRGLCPTHYDRWLRNGHTENTRPADWGTKRKHPLSETWRHTIKCRQGRVERWNEMWPFVEDVGERPEGCRLKRLDKNLPWGPDNFFWQEFFAPRGTNNEEKNARARAYRTAHPEKHKGYDLKKKYGLTLEDYDRMMEAQGGNCAICGRRDDVFGRLVVDHCHDSKKVRGLLCNKCNQAVGLLRNDPETAMSLALYLERSR